MPSNERGPRRRYVSDPEVSRAVRCKSVAIALCEVRVACEWVWQMYVIWFVVFLVQVFCPWLWCCLMPPLITLPASGNAERHYATFLKRPSVVTCRLATVAGAGWYHLKQ
ncbi:hypothetical protein BCR43DRAFT_499176 [Syncephalastrum racemosum]|uniref:Uncharacterized protein n=1 Tax=Syncephalastrum racemosum TaxID=13706 RepID=A0A1X2H035_SYNRA|nr:hypothetical protein BCR43DRAFT_499176 [Syncephalastrum racemosum]